MAGGRHFGGRFTYNGNNREELLCRESDAHCVAVNGQILDGERTLGQETCLLWLQRARSCCVGGGDLCAARVGDAGDELNAVQVYEGVGRAETLENGRVRQWSNQRLHEHWRLPLVSVEVALRRVGWLQTMLRDETNHAQPLAEIYWTILGERSS